MDSGRMEPGGVGNYTGERSVCLSPKIHPILRSITWVPEAGRSARGCDDGHVQRDPLPRAGALLQVPAEELRVSVDTIKAWIKTACEEAVPPRD